MGACLQLAAQWLLPGSQVLATVAAFVLVMAISIGFEVFSLVTGWGHYDLYDAIASIIGGVLGIGIVLLLVQQSGLSLTFT